jgi:DNA polymerase III subunit chi
VRVDFYQLGASPVEKVVASLGEKLLRSGERLLVVADDDARLARLDRMLWDMGETAFLPHGVAGGPADSRQPILLSKSLDSANRASNILIADGHWRDSALAFARAFYLFDTDRREDARGAWRSLAGRDEVERHYFAQEDGRWTEKAADSRHPA